MEAGFFVQHSEADEGLQMSWHPGQPRPGKGNFLGIDLNTSNTVKVDPERLEPVTQYRCSSCGFLEAYAH